MFLPDRQFCQITGTLLHTYIQFCQITGTLSTNRQFCQITGALLYIQAILPNHLHTVNRQTVRVFTAGLDMRVFTAGSDARVFIAELESSQK